MAETLDLSYPNLLKLLGNQLAGGRTESRAFLAWFLEHYYRLDETEAADTVCDGPDDKGIDGIFVDLNLETIDVFQCRIVQRDDRTLGDTQLKEFFGTLAQLESAEAAEELVASTGNVELANLLKESKVAQRIKDGFAVRGLFVANATADDNARVFLKGQENLELYDAERLQVSFVPVGPTPPVEEPIAFDVFGYDCPEYKIEDTRVVIAPLKATDLVKLGGIANGGLFVWNVRQSLGKTKVNKAIARSIADQKEHKNFLLFHNGLTMLCRSLEIDDSKISISGYSVVNGCQSLSSFYENRDKVSGDLRVLARLIELPPDNELAGRITQNTNNQNPISTRDLQSNSTFQRRLQNEFHSEFNGDVFYRIKRGEETDWPYTIENEDAARCLLAFDIRQPWVCHQSYKLFDELHAEIFARPEVTARRILVLDHLYREVESAAADLVPEVMGRYRLTKYFLLFLLREALETDEKGKQFCQTPETYLEQEDGRERIRSTIQKVAADLVIDLNAELKERESEGSPFDYKRELKSPTAVRGLSKSIIPMYQKAVARKRATSFGEEWAESGSK